MMMMMMMMMMKIKPDSHTESWLMTSFRAVHKQIDDRNIKTQTRVVFQIDVVAVGDNDKSAAVSEMTLCCWSLFTTNVRPNISVWT